MSANNTSASPASWVKMTMINYSAVVYATELAIIHAKKQGRKLVVVNVASSGSKERGGPGWTRD
jgi:NADP-dependent 3-hydroxy acid dehydrogenase YdfG